MEKMILVLCGMFVGAAIIGYIAISSSNRKDRRILNQKKQIQNRDDLINRQQNQLSKIKNAINKRYYTVEKLENEINNILNPGRHYKKI